LARAKAAAPIANLGEVRPGAPSSRMPKPVSMTTSPASISRQWQKISVGPRPGYDRPTAGHRTGTRTAAIPYLEFGVGLTTRRGPHRGTRVDIASWLHGLGLQQYDQAFRDNAIDDPYCPN
jgi:hypothetical protein